MVQTLRVGKDFWELGEKQSGEVKSFWMERIQTTRTGRFVLLGIG